MLTQNVRELVVTKHKSGLISDNLMFLTSLNFLCSLNLNNSPTTKLLATFMTDNNLRTEKTKTDANTVLVKIWGFTGLARILPLRSFQRWTTT